MTLLVVDDDATDRELLRVAFAKVEPLRECITYESALDALDWLENAHDDGHFPRSLLIVTDLKMPQVDGAQLISRIRERWKPGPRVIALSTSQQDMDLARAYAAGANAYHTKPMGFHETVELCKQISSYWNLVATPSTAPS